MEKGLARFRVSLLCFCCGCFVAAGLLLLLVAAGLLRLLWSAEVADSRRRSFPLRGSLPFSGANAACGCLPPQRRRNSNRVLAQCPVGSPMPPAAVCHLSAAGTPTASWSSAQSGCQCLLRLSATSAPRALQPRPGTGTMPTSTPEASWRGEGDIYRPFGTGTLNRTTSGAGSRGKTVWNRCQTGLLPMLRPDFGTASPARGLSVASRRGEAVIYRLFVHKMPLFHGR